MRKRAKTTKKGHKTTPKHGMASFKAIGFLKYYGINYEETCRYLLKWDEELGAAIADLNTVYEK